MALVELVDRPEVAQDASPAEDKAE
jgi:hypothetical protein